jgi:Galactose oxidase, central domain
MRSSERWIQVAMGCAVGLVIVGCGQRDRASRVATPASEATAARVIDGGALVEARDGHHAVRLADGRVLVTGGRTLSTSSSSTAEVYDPRAGVSRPLFASMLSPRAGHEAVLLTSGEVWILGGRDEVGLALDTTELFDPQTETFSPGPQLGVPRVDIASHVTPGGDVVLASGASVEVWSPAGERRSLFALPGGDHVGGSLVALDEERLLLLGAQGFDGATLPPVVVDLVAEVSVRQPGPFVGLGTAARSVTAGLPSQVFVVGGRLEGVPRTSFQTLEPIASGGVAPVQSGLVLRPQIADDGEHSLSAPRDVPAVLAIPQGVLVVGGERDGSPTDEVELVSPAGNVTTRLSEARTGTRLTVLGGGAVLISGGRGADGLPLAGLAVFLLAGVEGPTFAGGLAGQIPGRAPLLPPSLAPETLPQPELEVSPQGPDPTGAERTRLLDELLVASQQVSAYEDQSADAASEVQETDTLQALLVRERAAAEAEVERRQGEVADREAEASTIVFRATGGQFRDPRFLPVELGRGRPVDPTAAFEHRQAVARIVTAEGAVEAAQAELTDVEERLAANAERLSARRTELARVEQALAEAQARVEALEAELAELDTQPEPPLTE